MIVILLGSGGSRNNAFDETCRRLDQIDRLEGRVKPEGLRCEQLAAGHVRDNGLLLGYPREGQFGFCYLK